MEKVVVLEVHHGLQCVVGWVVLEAHDAEQLVHLSPLKGLLSAANENLNDS